MPIVSSKDLAKDMGIRLADKIADPDKYRGYKMGIPWLEKATGGFGKDWYSQILGSSKAGKTSLMTSFLIAVAGNSGQNVLYVTLEESLEITYYRIVSNLKPVSRTKFRDLTLSQSDLVSVAEADMLIKNWKVSWCDDAFTLKALTTAIDSTDADIVFIDYVQLMTDPGHKSKVEEISAISKGLVRIKKGIGLKRPRPISVVGSVQLNDNEEVLWSRDILRDADIQIEIGLIDDGNNGYLTDKRFLQVKNFRHGAPEGQEVFFNGARSSMYEMMGASKIHNRPKPITKRKP